VLPNYLDWQEDVWHVIRFREAGRVCVQKRELQPAGLEDLETQKRA